MDLSVIPILFKLYGDKDKIEQIITLLTPVIDLLKPVVAEVQKVEPQTWNLVREVVGDVYPELDKQLAGTPLITFDVTWLQTSLVKLGYPMGVDGDYGDETTAAVKKFQAANKIKVDGWAGQETCTAILVALGKLKA